jgi:deoxyadenosine/deoxycytidine kinase
MKSPDRDADMIVEFIGSTGAGKTTLAAGVRAGLARHVGVASPFEVLANRGWLAGLRHPTTRNLVQEIVAFPWFVRALASHAMFIRFVITRILQNARLGLQPLHYVRSLERTLGVHEVLRRRPFGGVVLVDEGTLVTAHNLFVFGSRSPDPCELATFADLVPRPDVVVYVRAPVASVVERAMARPDPPREMRSQDRAEVERCARRAAAVYESLARALRIKHPVITVDYPDAGTAWRRAAADRVVARLLALGAADTRADAIGRAS